MAAILAPPQKVYTADDLFCMPPDARFELMRGELVPMPPQPGGEHGHKNDLLSSRVSVFVDDHDLGACFAAETGFKIASDPDTVLAPDWAFITKERLPNPIPRKHVPLAPDLILETVSPNDTAREVAFKVQNWLDAGVKTVWVLDPRTKTVAVHRSRQEPMYLGATDLLTDEELLPGFEYPLSRLFR
jgi:Uma2 family endonuclease